jgi:superkiller protein 3
MMMALTEPTADEQFSSAFREWGLDVDAMPASKAVARLKRRPAVVVTEVIAALDEWANQRRLDKKLEAARRVAELAAALDAKPDSLRRELREILARERLPVERALAVLSAALRPVPAAPPLGQDCARLRQLAGRVDPAAEPVLGLLTLARALCLAGEESLAEGLLRKALMARPREVVLYYTLGQLLQEQEPPRWPEAVECYAVARALRPDLGVTLAMALLRSGRKREGLELLVRLVKEKPDNPYLHFRQAYALYNKGDLDGTVACYQKALELDPKLAPAHCNLGNSLHDKGDRAGAIACWKKAIALDPKYAKAHNNLGVALYEKHDLDGAIASYWKALEFDPKYAKAHNNVAVALRDQGLRERAVESWMKALELDPKLFQARFYDAVALYDKGEVDGAACDQKALDPKFAYAHNNLGVALYEKHDLDGAVASYQKALELHPKFAYAHNNLGNALKAKGDRDGAIARYQKALTLDPKLAPAHYNLGTVLRDKSDLDSAIACFRKALELDPKFAEAWGALGQTLQMLRRYPEAREATRRALALLPPGHPLQRVVAEQLRKCEQ